MIKKGTKLNLTPEQRLYRSESIKAVSTTHGKSNTKLHSIWTQMRRRCRDKNHQNYKWYGGKGITVCERWDKSFSNFHEDMGDPPTGKESIDRIDNNLGYFKENCRWSDMRGQGRNKSSTKLSEESAEFIRKQYSMSDGRSNAEALAKKFGVSKSTINRVLAGKLWKQKAECSSCTELKAKLAEAEKALEMISDPRKRDHREPDLYTENGCMMHMADEALKKIRGES